MTEEIINDLKKAMKAQDKFRLSVLRMLKSSLQNEAINQKKELTDEEVLKVIKKQVKLRKDSLEEYEKYNKLDTIADLKEEIKILNEYLPVEPSYEEILFCVNTVFEEIKPDSMKEMGLIMKTVGERLANADMTTVSKIVKEKLS